MKRWGMAIDLDRCTACGACTVACAQENNVALGNPERPDQLIRWMEILPAERGTYPEVSARLAPSPCQHCDREPPCVRVCPVYATYRNVEGLVPQIYEQCIGCRYCVNACPYTCKHFNWTRPEFPAPLDRGLNPDVSVRNAGVMEKCNFCYHRLQLARDAAAQDGRELKQGEYGTACQEACPTRAIRFGDFEDDLDGIYEHERAFTLLEDLGLEPKIVYLKEKKS
jgi:molybdopterin-containing oxidoreductase family iron-sulfur binding subunit